jgi:hypothetical protein
MVIVELAKGVVGWEPEGPSDTILGLDASALAKNGWTKDEIDHLASYQEAVRAAQALVDRHQASASGVDAREPKDAT